MQKHTPRLRNRIASSFFVHRLLLYLRFPASYVAAKPIPNRRYTAATVPSSPRCRTVSHTHACTPFPLTWHYTASPEPGPSPPYGTLGCSLRMLLPLLGSLYIPSSLGPPHGLALASTAHPGPPSSLPPLSPSGPQAMGQSLQNTP